MYTSGLNVVGSCDMVRFATAEAHDKKQHASNYCSNAQSSKRKARINTNARSAGTTCCL